MGGCQNYGPFLDPYYLIFRVPKKGIIILTTTHIGLRAQLTHLQTDYSENPYEAAMRRFSGLGHGGWCTKSICRFRVYILVGGGYVKSIVLFVLLIVLLQQCSMCRNEQMNSKRSYSRGESSV